MPATQDLLRRDSEGGAGLLAADRGGVRAAATPHQDHRRRPALRPGTSGGDSGARCGQRDLGDLEGLEQPGRRVDRRRGSSPSFIDATPVYAIPADSQTRPW